MEAKEGIKEKQVIDLGQNERGSGQMESQELDRQ
jgi:hypothetical protein